MGHCWCSTHYDTLLVLYSGTLQALYSGTLQVLYSGTLQVLYFGTLKVLKLIKVSRRFFTNIEVIDHLGITQTFVGLTSATIALDEITLALTPVISAAARAALLAGGGGGAFDEDALPELNPIGTVHCNVNALSLFIDPSMPRLILLIT